MNDRVDIDELFPESLLQRLEEAHEARAQLLHVETLLGEWRRVRDWLRDEDEDELETYRGLKALRAELLERMSSLETTREGQVKPTTDRSGPAARVVRRPFVDWGDIGIRYPFGCAPSEGSVLVPVALEGTSVVPGGVHQAQSPPFRRPIRGKRQSPITRASCG